MTITPHDLPNKDTTSNIDLVDYTTDILKAFEGFVPFIYDDGKGIPTLGYGVALVVKGLDGRWKVLTDAEIDDIFDGLAHQLSISDRNLLRAAVLHLNGEADPDTGIIPANPFHTIPNIKKPNPTLNITSWTIGPDDGVQMIKNLLSSVPSRPVTQAIDMINGPQGLRNRLGQVDGVYLWDTYKDSREGAALLSLWYNGQSAVIPSGSRLIQALKAGDRAAAWYEIRYQSNLGRDPGIAKRRYLEAGLFGLYNDPANVSDTEAQQVLDMFLGNTNASGFASNRRQMWDYDTAHQPAFEKANTHEDLADIRALILDPEHEVISLRRLFLPIADYIARTYAPGIVLDTSSINGEVLLGPASSTEDHDIIQPKSDNPADQQNDLLVALPGGADTLEGRGGDDILIGGDGTDTLLGGDGTDQLYGGRNSSLPDQDDLRQDILEGGAGFDTFFVGLNDIIRDSDGQGVIHVHGQAINLSYLSPIFTDETIYYNNDPLNPVRIRLDTASGDLHVMGSYFTIRDFNDGDFGIHLDPAAAPQALNLIEGTAADDVLMGTTATDEIHGLGGDDTIDGNDGDDVVFGEAGDDVLGTGAGHDVLDGGLGRDVLRTGAGKDVLLGGAGENFLLGAEGDDYLEGGGDRDYLVGGEDRDALFGGAGNDVLWGDATLAPLDQEWTVTVTDATPTQPGGRHISFSGSIIGGFISGNDQGDLLDGGGYFPMRHGSATTQASL